MDSVEGVIDGPSTSGLSESPPLESDPSASTYSRERSHTGGLSHVKTLNMMSSSAVAGGVTPSHFTPHSQPAFTPVASHLLSSPQGRAAPGKTPPPRWSPCSQLNYAAVIAILLAWCHGWVSGVTQAESKWHLNWLLAAAAAALATGISWGHPLARRVLVALVYMLVSLFIMATSSSVAWYRNPKHAGNKTHTLCILYVALHIWINPLFPPAGHLPDIIHDLVAPIETVSIPYLSWGKPYNIGGLEAAETLMSVLISTTLVWALCQPCRWLILRRAFVIYGTLALWRSVTIIVTAVPDASPRCSAMTPGTVHILEMPWKDALVRGITLMFGVDSDPCRSAGDMVFSGHTMVVVLMGMMWHAYFRVTPGRCHPHTQADRQGPCLSFHLIISSLFVGCRLVSHQPRQVLRVDPHLCYPLSDCWCPVPLHPGCGARGIFLGHHL
jgi:hypothetical protein